MRFDDQTNYAGITGNAIHVFISYLSIKYEEMKKLVRKVFLFITFTVEETNMKIHLNIFSGFGIECQSSPFNISQFFFSSSRWGKWMKFVTTTRTLVYI